MKAVKSIDTQIASLQTVLKGYVQQPRDMPWRQPEPGGTFDAYKILVSECMLQQTQVSRVIPKFEQFITRLPTIGDLAAAPLSQVLVLWSGLGYNRRAKYLHDAAKYLTTMRDQPWSLLDLVACKGIGPNTAAAIVVYAYNKPEVFVETNIRTVIIHHFFADQQNVPDKTIQELTARIIDVHNPRLFYWAMMDYGTVLKKSHGNVARRSKVYAKQTKFEGSLRQLRGQVLREATSPISKKTLLDRIDDPRCSEAIVALQQDGLLKVEQGIVELAT